MIFGFFLISVGIVGLFANYRINIKNAQILNEGYRTSGKVIGYKRVFIPTDYSSWSWKEYPKVEYFDEFGERRNDVLKLSKLFRKYFSLYEDIIIVVHKGEIYYEQNIKSKRSLWISVIWILIGLIIEISVLYLNYHFDDLSLDNLRGFF